MAEGKTEGMVVLRGEGSQRTRWEMFENADGARHDVRVTDVYKQLVSLTDVSKTRNRELAARRAAGDCATEAPGLNILRNRALPRCIRTNAPRRTS